LPVLVVADPLPPEPVDGLAVCGGGEPAARGGRDAVGRPPLDGGGERLRGRLLGEVEVAVPPRERGDHPRPLLAVGPGEGRRDLVAGRSRHRNGRTSILRWHAFDASRASRSATSRSGASRIQKPTTNSLVSTKGPSATSPASSRLSIVVATAGPPSPPANTQCPSARSWSLDASMAAISASVARSVPSSITERRYCMASS